MNKPARDERMLTVREIAERLNCSQKTVRREIATGALSSVRIGPAKRLVRVTELALRAYQALRNG